MTRKLLALLLSAVFLCFAGCGESAQKNDPAADVYLDMAQNFIDSGDLDSARTVLKDAIEKSNDARLQDKLNEVNEMLLGGDVTAETTVVETTAAETTEAAVDAEEAAMFNEYAGTWRYSMFEELTLDVSFDAKSIMVNGKYFGPAVDSEVTFAASTAKETFFEYGCKLKFIDSQGASVVGLLKPAAIEFSDGIWKYFVWTLESIDGEVWDSDVILYRDSEYDTMYNRMTILECASTYSDGASAESGGNILHIGIDGTTVNIEYENCQSAPAGRVASVSHSVDIADFDGDTVTFDFTDSWGNSGTMQLRLYFSPVGYCADINIYNMIYDDNAMWSVSEGNIWVYEAPDLYSRF